MLTRRASLARLAASLTLTAPVLALSRASSGSPQESDTQGTGTPHSTGEPADRANVHDVRAFGAKGNRRDFDDEAFRRAIASALTNDQYPGTLRIPAGHYRRSRPIALPNEIAVRGDGPSSVINSQNDTEFNAPILTNLFPKAAVSWRLADLSLYGGSHGVKLDVTGEIANLRFDDVGMLMQSTANIEANKLFQTSKFFGGVLGSAPYGLKVDGPTTNAFNSFGLEWTDHSTCSLYLRGAEVVLIIGGRFEGGGQAGKSTIDIEDGASITFIGVYFENVHEYLARLRRVQVVSFVNCHFTGTNAGSPEDLAPFKWDIDANLLTFRDCHSTVPMPVPNNVVLDGVNVNIFPVHAVHEMHGLYGRICAAPRALASAETVDLVALVCNAAAAGAGVHHCELVLTIAEADGMGVSAHWRGTFDIVEQGAGSRIVLPPQADIRLGRATVALAVRPDGRLVARCRIEAGGGKPLPQMSWTIDWRRVAGGPVSSVVLQVP